MSHLQVPDQVPDIPFGPVVSVYWYTCRSYIHNGTCTRTHVGLCRSTVNMPGLFVRQVYPLTNVWRPSIITLCTTTGEGKGQEPY